VQLVLEPGSFEAEITVVQLVLEPGSFEAEITVDKFERCKSPGINQIPAELIQAGGNTFRSEKKCLNCICSKEEFPEQWKECIILRIYKKGYRTDCSNFQGISLLSCYPIFFSLRRRNYWSSSMWIST
jgi:hypothetical protein